MQEEDEKVVFNWINIFVAVVFIFVALFGFYFVLGNNSQQETDNKDIEWEGGVLNLEIEDTVVGDGDEAVAGKTVTVHYNGTFENGKKFDSSYDRGEPFEFMLGAGQVIKGWDEGVVGMKVGGKRKLVIPPELGYGDTDNGPIPGNSTLYFEVELLGVK